MCVNEDRRHGLEKLEEVTVRLVQGLRHGMFEWCPVCKVEMPALQDGDHMSDCELLEVEAILTEQLGHVPTTSRYWYAMATRLGSWTVLEAAGPCRLGEGRVVKEGLSRAEANRLVRSLEEGTADSSDLTWHLSDFMKVLTEAGEAEQKQLSQMLSEMVASAKEVENTQPASPGEPAPPWRKAWAVNTYMGPTTELRETLREGEHTVDSLEVRCWPDRVDVRFTVYWENGRVRRAVTHYTPHYSVAWGSVGECEDSGTGVGETEGLPDRLFLPAGFEDSAKALLEERSGKEVCLHPRAWIGTLCEYRVTYADG